MGVLAQKMRGPGEGLRPTGPPPSRGARAAPRVPLVPILVALGALALLAGALVLLAQTLQAPSVPASRTAATAALVRSLQRTLATDAGVEVRLLLATPAYLRVSGQEALARRYGAERDLVLILSEDVHSGDLPAPLRPLLRVDGRPYAPERVEVVMDAIHHRASVAVYADAARALVDPAIDVVEVTLPGHSDRELRWERPFAEPAPASAPLSLPALLALLGGILASMWPCLFQLSAYFLPSVAGLSLEQAQAARAPRLPVLRTALLFVSGIVLVYTLAGAAAGFAAQSLASNALFDAARRPLTLLAGAVVVAMALRVAVRARAPLVCRMPVVSLAGRFGGDGPLGTMALGVAFATGCMTCFGAALVLGMFAYIVTLASPLVGAALLFLFSLGIAVPLVLAAVAMARVLPLLGRLERVAPALSLVSAGIMALYGLLLLTDSLHLTSDALARAAGILP